jgi:hypothetical protein
LDIVQQRATRLVVKQTRREIEDVRDGAGVAVVLRGLWQRMQCSCVFIFVVSTPV